MDQIQNILFSNFNLFSGFLACLIFILLKNKLNKLQKFIGLFVGICFLFDIAAYAIGYYYKNNQWFYNLAILVETSFLFFIYYQLFSSTYIKRAIKYAYPGFLFFFFLNYLFIQKQFVFNNYTFVPSYAFLALLAFKHLQQCVDELVENPFANFVFWFSMANLLDFTVSAPLLGILSWFAFENEKIASSLYLINDLVYVAWFTILSIGIIWTSKHPK